MDFFGIGQAIKTAVVVYRQSARGTGRTTSLVDGVKDGDRIVFASQKEAFRVKRLIKERGINVSCIVVNPKTPERIFEMGSVAGEGRNIFDHTWVEMFYENAINDVFRFIDKLERETSGYGAAHRETRRKLLEMNEKSDYTR